ncbi:peptidase C14 caspase catalytic subunit p20 [Streptomyces sp. F-3]|uniref:hypothetical protein n=1 Tax=Streptomyces sp. F-3 TaxID=1840095 RepID=UPI0007C2DB00|nr:hypothetical protein [Streptomyces sp. F-3]GAT79375.1 peptidase C14 caspase catalytic subunit p20 [Streptomyces sp. F-3]
MALAHYACPKFDRRHLITARDRFVEVMYRLGFGMHTALEGTGRRHEIINALEAFAGRSAERKVLYWTGHGQIRGHDYCLVCADGYDPQGKIEPANIIRIEEIVGMFSHDSADVLLVFDACYAERRLDHAAMVAELNKWERREADRWVGTTPGLAVVCTARADQQAEAGQWVDWLVETVHDPHAAVKTEHIVEQIFHPTARSVELNHLLRAVEGRVPDDDCSQRPISREIRRLRPGFLHNPYFTNQRFPPARRPAGDRSWLRLGAGPRAGDGALASFGIADLKHFSGRRRALGRVVRWMETHDHGLLAVTGPAGSGKTAFIGCLVHLTIPGFPESMTEPPPVSVQPRPESVHAAVHCAGKSLHELAHDVCQALSPLIGPVGEETGPPAPGPEATIGQRLAWIGTLVRRVGSLVVVFDGLDEAAPGQATDIARDLLNPLSAVPGVKVLVGTREHPRRTAPGRVDEESLPEALRQTVPAVELDQDDDSEADIACYVQRVLAARGSPYETRNDERLHAAQQIAKLSHRNFLVANLCARDLVLRDEPLSSDALGATVRRGTRDLAPFLERELAAVAAVLPTAGEEDEDDPDLVRRQRIRDLLLPLSVAQGAGLPESVWLVMANAVREDFTPEFTPELLATVATRARGALTMSVPDGDRVLHRMLHPSFGTWLLADTDPQRLHRRIFSALYQHTGGKWADADRYVRRYLAAHAAQGGRELLARLMSDDEFLVHADPDILLPLVDTGPEAGRQDQLYRRVAGEFRKRPSAGARRALLLAERRVHYPEDYVPSAALLWRDQWTNAEPEPFHQRWPGPTGDVAAVFWSAQKGSDDLIMAAGRGEVVARRARTGVRTRVYRSSSVPWEDGGLLTNVCEVGSGLGRMIAALDGRAVLLWRGDKNVPVHRLFWGSAPRSLAAAEFYGQAYLAAADGSQAWLWRWPARRPPSVNDITRIDLGMRAELVRLLSLDEKLLLLVAQENRISVHRLAWRWKPSESPIERSQSLGTVTNVTALAALADGADDAWFAAVGAEFRLWRLSNASGAMTVHDERSAASLGAGTAVTLGRAGGRPVVAVQNDDLVTVQCVGEKSSLTWFRVERKYEALCFDPRGTGNLAAADKDHVRIVPLAPRLGSPRPPRNHDEPSLVRLVVDTEGATLLVRARGPEVLLGSRVSADAGYRDVGEPLRGEDTGAAIGAVTALAIRDGWVVVSAAGRVMRLWHVPVGPGSARLLKELRSPGDRKDEPLSGALCRIGGRLHWFVPHAQRLEHWVVHEDFLSTPEWQQMPGVSVQDAVKIRWTQAMTAPDGSHWLAAQCGESVRLWRLDETGAPAKDRAPFLMRPPAQHCLALGMLAGDKGITPLLAGADRQCLWWAAVSSPDQTVATELSWPSGIREITALVLVGPPHYPLLLVCGRGPDSVAVWDIVSERWVLTVPYRGYEVETAAAVWDGHDVRLVLQGGDRCDELVLSGDRLAGCLGIEAGWFKRPWYGPMES